MFGLGKLFSGDDNSDISVDISNCPGVDPDTAYDRGVKAANSADRGVTVRSVTLFNGDVSVVKGDRAGYQENKVVKG